MAVVRRRRAWQRRGLCPALEPVHGEVAAQRRRPQQRYGPGSRAYLSAGLPGAPWWVAGRAADKPEDAEVELDEVERLYTEHDMWDPAFGR
jgi:hypothetical protein